VQPPGAPAQPPPDDQGDHASRGSAPLVPTDRAVDGAAERRTLLAALMREHGNEIYRFCFSMLGDRALADDVHQSVFVDAFEALARLADRSKARAWLYGIARHRCLDAAKARRRWNWRFVLSPDAGEREADHQADESSDLTTDAPRLSALLACVRGLPPHVRAAVLLRYEEDLPYEEIARMSRERAATLQMRVARGLVSLRTCIAKKIGDGSNSQGPRP
jgi:RNA polymerase sigma-70 factor (ECF subfamily)